MSEVSYQRAALVLKAQSVSTDMDERQKAAKLASDALDQLDGREGAELKHFGPESREQISILLDAGQSLMKLRSGLVITLNRKELTAIVGAYQGAILRFAEGQLRVAGGEGENHGRN